MWWGWEESVRVQRRQEIFQCLAVRGACPGDQQGVRGNVVAAAAHPLHLPSLLQLPPAATQEGLNGGFFSRRRQFNRGTVFGQHQISLG